MSDSLNSKNVITSDPPEISLEKNQLKETKEQPIRSELSFPEQPSIKNIIKNSGNFISKSEISKFGLKAIENENKKNKLESNSFSNFNINEKKFILTKKENDNSQNTEKNIIVRNDQKVKNENNKNDNNLNDNLTINTRKKINYSNETNNNDSSNEQNQNVNNFEKINFVNNININNYFNNKNKDPHINIKNNINSKNKKPNTEDILDNNKIIIILLNIKLIIIM